MKCRKFILRVNRQANSGLDQIHSKCIITAAGEVLWMAPYVLQLSCHVDLKYFPYDTQVRLQDNAIVCVCERKIKSIIEQALSANQKFVSFRK